MEPPDPFTAGVKLLSFSWCTPHIDSSTCEEYNYDSSDFFPHLWSPVYMFFAPLNSQKYIHLYNVRSMHYSNISLYANVDRLFLLTQSAHILHWHYQLPEAELLLCFSLHIAPMHKHQGHQMHSQPQFPTPIADVFPVDLNADVSLVIVPSETPATRAVFVTKTPVISAPTMNLLSEILSSFFRHATVHSWMLNACNYVM